ncbi:MAG: V-type ATP synthase subunit F [Chloroflexota bacterium]|jgi:V/A-type H+-transporting ATPase subunit F
MKLFIIGHEDTVLGFSLIGIEGFATDDAAEALRKIEELLSEGEVGLIVITAGIARRMGRRLEEIETGATVPVILRVPAPGEPLERPSVREMVRHTLGAGM